MKKTVSCDTVPCRVTKETAAKLADLTKTLPESYSFKRRTTVAEIKDVEPSSRTDVAVITSASLDRDNEIVLPEGIVLDDYRANPVVLFNHEQSLPCGKALWIKTDDAGRLVMKTFYPERPADYEGDWLPDRAFALVQAGILKGKSIGFLPLEIREPTPEELERFPDVERVISRSLLLEVSCVTVPSNPDALIQAVNKGLIKVRRVGQVRPKADLPLPAPTPKPKKRKPITLDHAEIVRRVMENLDQGV